MRVEAKGNLTVTLIRQHTLGVDRLHAAQPVRPAVIEVCPQLRANASTAADCPVLEQACCPPTVQPAAPVGYADDASALRSRLPVLLPAVDAGLAVQPSFAAWRPRLVPLTATAGNMLDVLA